MPNHIIKIDRSLCDGCNACVLDCPSNNIKNENGKVKTFGNSCIMCGHCVAVCPKNAVSITGFEDKIEEKPEIRLNPDDIFNTVKFRRSVRQFKKAEIPDEIIKKIIEAGRVTHTASNSQNVGIRVLKENIVTAEEIAVKFFRGAKKFADPFSEKLKRNKITNNFFFYNAPLVIVVLSKNGVPFSEVDASLAAANMEFVAEANGLGVLHSGFFSICINISHKLRKMLKVPISKKAVTTLVIGYPKVKYFRSVNRENGDVKFI